MKKITLVVLLIISVLQFSFSQGQLSRPEPTVSAHIDRMVFMEPEKMPQFPGGLPEMDKFINTKLNYPREAVKSNVQGTVFVGFVIDTDGKVKDVRVLKGIGSGCEEEVVRVLQQMPQWQPGTENGSAVAVSYSLPVDFKLPAKDQQPK